MTKSKAALLGSVALVLVFLAWAGAAQADPPPTVTGLSPAFGLTAGGTLVTITGLDFTEATAVNFDGIPATGFDVLSDTQIAATAPAHGKGAVRVEVINADGGSSEAGAADDFTYQVTYTPIRGSDRYDTAIRISQALYPGVLPPGSGAVLAPGETFPEALCGAPLAAAFGGPVLLTPKWGLNNAVKAELQRLAPERVFCIGLATSTVSAVKAALPTAAVTSISGDNVYAMSRNVARALADKVGDGGKMPAAMGIITRGDVFPDAIGVSPLACAKLWPIILTNGVGGALHVSASGALNDLGITQTLKVGTYATMPTGVTALANLSGSDRYATNANVAAWATANAGLTLAHTGVATGDKFPDALASGPYLSKDGGILLLSPLSGPLPSAVAAQIAANQAAVQHVTFIAMLGPVMCQVGTLLPEAAPSRILDLLPYGDSKTVGLGDETHQGGYRDCLGTIASGQIILAALPCIARGGWGVTSMAGLVNTDLAGCTWGTPDAVLINLGTNLTETAQPAWVTPMLRIVDAIHEEWPNAQVFIARVYRPSRTTQALTQLLNDVWIPAVVAERPDFVHLGIDERTFLPGNGLMSDTFHPNGAGYVRTAEEWNAVLEQWFGQ